MLDNLRLGLARRLYSPQRIEKAFKSLAIQPPEFSAPLNPKKPVAAAVSFEYRICDTVGELIKNIGLYFSKAAAKRASIVVLPEFFQLCALSLVPGFSRALKAGKKRRLTAYDLLKSLKEEQLELLNQIVLTSVALFAKTYSVYVVCGAGLVRKNGGIRLRSYLFDREGKIIGHQDKMFVSDECDDAELLLSDNLSVLQTDIGAISILAGGDSLEWKCYKSAVEAGATVIAAPCALRENYDSLAAMRDVMCNVQYYYAFGIKACLIGGDEIGLRYKGKSLITAPFRMTPQMDGRLACASSPEKGSVITSELDMTLLDGYTDFYTGK